MTVINPNSISGITSITLPSGDGNVLTIHTNDGTERFRIDSSGNVKVGSACTISQDGDVFFTGVTTATTFTGAHSGSGANLTSLPAAQLTGSLPAISGANLTGIAATDNVRTGILEVAGIATFSSDVKIGAAVTISESGIEASGIGITVANINGTQIGGRRNLVINGAMQVAQRGTSSTSTDNYNTIDRLRTSYGTQDEIQTNSQGTLSSSDSPYTEGLRYYHRTQNGNQTSGAQGGSYVIRSIRLEAQDIAASGWNYTNPNSFITLQFWVRSSVAQDYMMEISTRDGTSQTFVFLFSLAANTWTKVTRTIPGHSNLTFNNDNGVGLDLSWYAYIGTTYTGSSTTLDAWIERTGTYRRTMTTTWFTTNDSTFDITGVQLEVGSQATAFEHRSFENELTSCYRYYQVIARGSDGTAGARAPLVSGSMWGTGSFYGVLPFKNRMRTTPSLDVVNGDNYWQVYNNSTDTCDTLSYNNASPDAISLYLTGNLSGTAYVGAWSRTNNAAAFVAATAEL